MQIGENLRYLRNMHNKTQQELADVLKTTRQGYNHYECNRRYPDYDTLVKIADYYMVSLDVIFGRIIFPKIEKAV